MPKQTQNLNFKAKGIPTSVSKLQTFGGGCVGCSDPKGGRPYIGTDCLSRTSGSSSGPLLSVTREEIYDMEFHWAFCNSTALPAFAIPYCEEQFTLCRSKYAYGECGSSLCGDEGHSGGGYNFVLYMNDVPVTKFNFNALPYQYQAGLGYQIRIRDLANYVSIVEQIFMKGSIPSCPCNASCGGQGGSEIGFQISIRPDPDYKDVGVQKVGGSILLKLAGQQYFTCLAREWGRCGGAGYGGAPVYWEEELVINPFNHFCICGFGGGGVRRFPPDTEPVAL